MKKINSSKTICLFQKELAGKKNYSISIMLRLVPVIFKYKFFCICLLILIIFSKTSTSCFHKIFQTFKLNTETILQKEFLKQQNPKETSEKDSAPRCISSMCCCVSYNENNATILFLNLTPSHKYVKMTFEKIKQCATRAAGEFTEAIVMA